MTQNMIIEIVRKSRTVMRLIGALVLLVLAGGNASAQDSGSGEGGESATSPTGVHVNGSVYGGGNLADVGGSVTVNIKAGTVDKDVYGGGALANTNTNNTTDPSVNTTTVNLLGGTISGDAYGGGLGRIGVTAVTGVHFTQDEIDNAQEGDPAYGKTTDDWKVTPVTGVEEKKATVYGDINVYLGGDKDGAKASATAFNINYYQDNANTSLDESTLVKSGRVFGCNNLNGSPQGNVTVTVWKTVEGSTPRTSGSNPNNLKSPNDGDHSYELAAVYGGGNLSNYEPTATGKKAHVIINGCDVASILTVYGGGNAAAVPETDVDIYGSYEIGAVFGGGNGKDPYTLDNGTTWTTNSGANVNGNANTMLYGGLIHEAFGGSNEKGRITGNVSINTDPDGSECDLDVGTIYGAGKNADIDGDLIVTLGCMRKRTDAVYGGAENANVKGNVELTITSGEFGKVFGGNNQSGAIFGSITLNIMESGCTPIKIDELYLGGNQAAYSVYGYYHAKYYADGSKLYLDAAKTIELYQENSQLYLDNTKAKALYQKTEGTLLYLDEELTKPFYMPRTSKDDSNAAVYFGIPTAADDHTKPNTTTGQYADPVLNIVSATEIGKVFGGGLGSGAALYGNPTVNINQAYPLEFDSYNSGTTTYKKKNETFGAIGGGYGEGTNHVDGGIFGGGNEAFVYGNTTVNIGTETTVPWKVLVLDDAQKPVLDANGKFLTQTLTDESYNTLRTVIGANIVGNVYGGGNLADVTGNTQVSICAKETGTGTNKTWTFVAEGTKKVTIAGNVYGGGKGIADTFTCEKAMVGTADAGATAGYSDGNTSVVIGNGTVGMLNSGALVDGTGNVYGGGEVGRMEGSSVVTIGIGDGGNNNSKPNILGSVFGAGSGVQTHGYSALVRGNSTVTVQGDATIGESVYGGGELASVGRYEIAKNATEANAHGVDIGEPYNLIKDGKCTVIVKGHAKIGPDNMTMPTFLGNVFGAGKGVLPYEGTNDTDNRPRRMYRDSQGDHIEYFDAEGKENDYFTFIKTLALNNETEVTIAENSFVKGSVYGGSENGRVREKTWVKIQGGQIGCGYDGGTGGAGYLNRPYSTEEWADVTADQTKFLYGCNSWAYGQQSGDNQYAPYDKFTHNTGDDGHTFYGNVFGGGSGKDPFASGRWLDTAGEVGGIGSQKGSTKVEITGGHILTSVYGGNELTDVEGDCQIIMSGGTIGVPRTLAQIEAQPVICNLYGAGKGDQRVLFNTKTNVENVNITISDDARIYGSVFGGGEDGHVHGNVTLGISGGTIGTWGTSYLEGNVFGGGRGFSGEALTAGVVQGNVDINISGTATTTKILGSVYGGGRLASVGTYLVPDNNANYGKLLPESAAIPAVYFTQEEIDNASEGDPAYGKSTTDVKTPGVAAVTHGHITIDISGGTIGNDWEYVNVPVTTLPANLEDWKSSHHIPNTDIELYETKTVKDGENNVTQYIYRLSHTKGGNVFAGSMGRLKLLDNQTYIPQWYDMAKARSTKLTISGNAIIKSNVYGGAELGSVGDESDESDEPETDIEIKGGTIGRDMTNYTFGSVFGGGYGSTVETTNPGNTDAHAPKLYAGIVYGDTEVNVDDDDTGDDTHVWASVYGGGELASVKGDTKVTVSDGTIGKDKAEADKNENRTQFGGAAMGNVYGGGKGNTAIVRAGQVWGDTKVLIKGGTIFHNVYGGGAYSTVGDFNYVKEPVSGQFDGAEKVKEISGRNSGGKATVTVTGGIIGVDGIENGMVFGSSRGGVGEDRDKLLAWVYDTEVIIGTSGQGTNLTKPTINGSVYGSGENGHVFHDTDVKIYSGTVGYTSSSSSSSVWDKTRGNVYGGGCGEDTNSDGTYEPTAGIVYGDANVTMTGGLVRHNIYGAGALGSVGKTNASGAIASGGTTTIIVSGGTVGVDGNNNGNIFGGARGDAISSQSGIAQVKTTDVTVSGGTVKGNVYGGGEIGCVGTFAETDGKYVWSSGGRSKVTVSGGKIGPDGNNNPEIGNVFGAGKGKANTFKCEKAMVRETIVSISDGTVNGNVYGGGEIGRVEEDTEVTIGRKSTEAEGAGTGKVDIKGSVFGAGKGKETHGYSALVRGDTRVTVEGDVGAKVGVSVYGGGEIASVGRYGLDAAKMPEILVDGGYCYVKVLGKATIGPENALDDKGNVFGAGKGITPAYVYSTSDRGNNSKRMVTYDPTGRHKTGQGTLWDPYDDPDDPNDDPTHPNFVWEYFTGNTTTGVSGEDEYKTYLETLALATHPEVTIGGNATVNGSVFGGGELGLTKGSVIVNIQGGTVVKDVYGGGSLANTNTTSTWAKRGTDGKPLPPDEHGNYTVDDEPVHPTTTVNLTGGKLRDAYGGALGDATHAPSVNGNVTVKLNEGKAETDKGCIVNRIFGCNNLNGTPKKKVQVYVYATQNGSTGVTQIANTGVTNAKVKERYDVQAVYGGGNLSPYVPDDALLEYTDANKATVDAARPEVYIDGCKMTSIKQVYGGGNAAPVPATFVQVNRCFEIDEVFGGGNGADNYSLKEGTMEVWYKNPGANVGYYDFTHLDGTGSGTQGSPYNCVDNDNAETIGGRQNPNNQYMYGSGIAKTEIRGGTIHIVYGGSNSKGNVRTKLSSTYSSMHDDCPMNIDQTYGSGKNAESDGEVDVVSNCAKGISEMFGGAKDADVDGDINLTITNGSSLERVFGGNNTSGAINGSITVTIKEGGCEPIRIGSLYAGGFLAPYSVYGYQKTNGVYDTEEVEYIDTDGTKKKKYQRIPLTSAPDGTIPKADPRINVISATRIDNIFGGGYQAKLVGSPHINVNMEPGRIPVEYTETIGTPFVGTHTDANGNTYVITATDDTSGDGILAIGTIGNIYGGGNMADIVGNTYVEIGTGTEHSVTTGELVAISPARNAATITGNVFGGGKGKADTFTCEKAMVGVADDPDKTIGNTYITIGNGTVGTLENGKLKEGTGNVYGGGEIGRVENNTNVTLGVDGGIGPEIYGYVYGAGAGVNTHGYSALVRGDATVLIQGNTKVGKSVYGGGEIASVGRYKVADAAYHAAHPDVEIGLPYTTNEGGFCTVTIKGNAEIGPDNMKMVTDTGWPTDEGHVFGAGKGILPYELTNTTDNRPRRMWRVKSTDDDWVSEWDNDYDGTVDVDGSEVKYKDIWEYYDGVGQEPAYLKYIQSLALATTTEVTIDGKAFVKGSVYGGSMNGHVQANTHVVIDGDCQIGNGDGVNKRYDDADWAKESLAECASWPYGHDTGKTDGDGNKIYEYLPYDVYDYQPGTTKPKPASDGHTFYGNVFGGGSGLFPYKQNPDWITPKDELGGKSKKDLGYSDGLWLRSAGDVNGNTHVEIKGGHVLTSVYGGNECTDVKGTSTVEMSGGTIGVPRTVDEIKAHPVTCYLFGAGKGDQRINFNTWTNVEKAIVNITGGHIFGSVFGGGEDGHVLGDVEMTISGNKTKIGTTGTSYVDGNIFGGGRGFSGDAQTAGTVGGNIEMTISGGDILGSVYGGGRLASVGTEFTAVDSPNYGNFVEDGEPIYYTQEDADAYNQENNLTEGMEDYKTTESIKTPATTHGHVTINISGGTIGNTVGNSESGNVFGGSMGRLTLLNDAINDNWPKMAQVKSTTVNIYDNANVKRTVFGGGELGTVRDNTYVTIGGTLGADKQTVTKSGSPVVGRDVYGGGYGSQDYTTHTMITAKMPKEGVTSPSSANDYQDVNYVFTPMIFAGCVGQNTYVNISGGHVKKSVYGGGEMASVGIIDCQVQKDNDAAEPVYTEGSDKYVYIKNHKHNNPDNDFVLSWPYHFEYTPDYLGATHVNITGGRIGLNAEENKEANNPFEDLDNGDVCGGGKGIAGDYNNYVFCANVGSTEVTINLESTADPAHYMDNDNISCIAGAVYGGAENGHVMGDTKLTLKKGLVGHSIYGGGSGKGQFETTLLKIGAPANSTAASDHYTRKIYSITAGKVFGNTEVIMEGGYVVRNVYGGGNMGSVGKGNYAGGPDDYSTAGYGEKITGDNNLWTNDNSYSKAFLSSGKSTVKILGGTVGYIDSSNPSNSMYPLNSTASLPYGNVFGGCRGESAPNIRETPRYLYSPEFFVGYVNETDVTIGAENSTTGPKIFGSVFGGGMDGHVRRDTHVEILGGEIGIPYTSENKTKVKTEDPNNIQWLTRGNVYGAGSGIGKYKYDFNYDNDFDDIVEYNNGRATVDTKEEDYSTSAGSVTRFTKVEIKGGNIYRNVYGGGSLSSVGAPKIGQGYDPYRPDDSEHSSEVGKQALNTVTISGGQIGDGSSYANGNYVYGGRVFGGSRGDTSLGNAFATANHTKVTVEEDAHVIGSVFGGGEAGIVKNDVTVTMSGGAVDHDFYGGGALANTNTSNWDASANNGAGAWADATNKSAVYTTAVNLKGGTIGRNAYGGGLGVKPVGSTAGTPALVYGDVLVKLNENTATDKCVVKGVVHGANNYFGSPKGDVTVHVYATMHDGKSNLTDKVSRDKDVEDALADNNATAADLKVFLADKISIATLWGVNVTEYQTVCDNPGATPADVKTAITDISDAITTAEAAATDEQKTTINANVNALRYDLKAVYGGGNEATYDPLDANTRKAHVIIDGCDLTSIETVYGGGNAAAAPETYVEVKSCYEIGTVFGGGNGKDALEDGTANPGAHVGYRDAAATDSYGTGKAYAELKGGTIHSAFGGSNTKGNVRTSATVDMNEPTPITCPLCIDEVYGAGNEAHQDGTSNIELGCISYLKEIYGGAKNANINNDVVLTIQSGRFDRVFGGNNLGGIIKGTVTVNIEETGCHPIIIGQLYGGGNQAAYDVNLIPTTGHVTDQTDINYYMNYPKVNVKSFTSIGEIYGGGYGSSATVTGNPYVTINECMGENATIEMKTSPADESLHTGETITINSGQSDEVQVKIPLHKSGAIGVIGNVFGGGNAAPVSGNTNVIIGNLDKINYVSIPDDDTTTGVDESERTVLGVDIQGNVYGGGNAAPVSGNTNVVIGKDGTATTPSSGGSGSGSGSGDSGSGESGSGGGESGGGSGNG